MSGDREDEINDQISNDSIASVIFPWKNRRPVPPSEVGREVTAESFYLCLMASFLIVIIYITNENNKKQFNIT